MNINDSFEVLDLSDIATLKCDGYIKFQTQKVTDAHKDFDLTINISAIAKGWNKREIKIRNPISSILWPDQPMIFAGVH